MNRLFKRILALALVAVLFGALCAALPQAARAEQELYGLAIDNISTRSGPSTKYEDTGTYKVKGQYIRVYSRAYDSVNEIWWVKCYVGGKVLWTGYKRFDSSTLPLNSIPIEGAPQPSSPTPKPYNPAPQGELYGLAKDNISTRSGPSTKYQDTGTYKLKGQYVRVYSRAYDSVNEIWWVKCLIPDNGRLLWTGYKRFDSSTLPLDSIPIEGAPQPSMPTPRPATPTPQPYNPAPQYALYGYAKDNLSTRSGPSTKYQETGTYKLKGQYVRVYTRAYDSVNEVWWVKCLIPENGRLLWTGYNRFDSNTLPLNSIPIEGQPIPYYDDWDDDWDEDDVDYLDCDYSCRKTVYTAGEPVTFDLYIYEGTAPYTVDWLIYEDSYEVLGEACILKKYWARYGDAGTSGVVYTYDTHVAVTYTPPVQGEDPMCIFFVVTDATGRTNDPELATAEVYAYPW